jgi:hypothetical protein
MASDKRKILSGFAVADIIGSVVFVRYGIRGKVLGCMSMEG